MNTKKWIAVDRYIEEQLQAMNIPGAAWAIVEGDQIVHLKGFGVSGPDGKTGTPDDIPAPCKNMKAVKKFIEEEQNLQKKIDEEHRARQKKP